MNKRLTLLLMAVLVLMLVACTPGTEERATADQNSGITLNADYGDALSVQGQLALGTVQLDETDLAVGETQAAELLPLWQALQSLGNSDTTATTELDAVVKQIQALMTAGQIQAISDMALTNASMTELLESGGLGFGGGFGGANAQQADDAQAADGGGFPAGGPPGGGVPGGGPGGGAGIPGGGFAGGPGGELDEDAIATRQASFNEGDFQEQLLTGAVIRLLAQKTGEDVGFPRGDNNPMMTVLTIISEATGLSVEDIQAQTADGVTLGALVEANGGDTEAIHAALVEALGGMPNAADQDLDQLANDWLAWPSNN